MRVACIVGLIGVLAGAAPPRAEGARHDELFRDGVWRLNVRRDRFTDEVHCQMRGRGMRLDGAWVVFALGKDVDTSQAYVRIDDQPARRIQDLAPTPYRRDWSADEAVFNPSGGEVAVPRDLLHGKSVWIRPSSHGSIKHFDYAGLDHVMQTAADRGC